MARNGSGIYAIPNIFTSGQTITASTTNGNNNDIGSEITNSLAVDGQSTMTGQLKAENGTAGAPAYTFGTDLDSGLYRIGANDIGAAVNGALVLSVTPGALGLVDGTVLLPSYTFISDPDSGIYRIGTSNIGVGVNGAKVLDIGTGGLNVVGTVSSNGAAFSPLAQGAGMVNGTIVESHTGNAATFAIKTLAGADPSATDPVFFAFRNVTAATGNYTVVQLTAALSLTVSSGSLLGASSAVPFRLWFVMFNDGGTLRLGVINCLSGTSIYPLAATFLASSTAEGGSGGADSAQVFYTGAAVTSKAYGIIGYASYESGLATAGSWAASPTNLQLFGAGVKLPGDVIQISQNATGAVATGTTAIPHDDSIPQNTEGDQYLSQAITPSSKANLLAIDIEANLTSSATVYVAAALFQDSTANALAVRSQFNQAAAGPLGYHIVYTMQAGISSATTFNVRAGGTAGTVTFNGDGGSRTYGGVINSYISVTERMT